MRIAFIHPDLGIGGAERLVVDAAVGLKQRGHEITVYTSYRDRSHCFEEARDGTLHVLVRGDGLVPANLYGRFAILCAMLRQIHLVLSILWSSEQYDAVFIDQLSIGIPFLKFFRPQLQILFYCHFPDKLLSSRKSWLKSLYRVPFDFLEEWTTGQADTILVNSNFTASIFAKAFPRINRIPKVLHPCVDVHQTFSNKSIHTNRKIVLSINRFERKKNIDLAIAAYALLDPIVKREILLVIAGGHDARVAENVQYHKELQAQCDQHALKHTTINDYSESFQLTDKISVYFLLSIPGSVKSSLLATSQLLLYTPENEHFGIVPLEASLAGVPVLAQNNGGPLETVEDGKTGYLRPPKADLWSEVIKEVSTSPSVGAELGQRGREKVIAEFSQETMSANLEEEFHALMARPKRSGVNVYAMALLAVFLVSLWKFVYKS